MKHLKLLMTFAGGLALIGGCGPQNQTVAPPVEIEHKTIIKPAPTNPPVIVQPVPTAKALPTPKITGTPKAGMAPTPVPQATLASPLPTPTSTPRIMVTPMPKASPKPKPAATAKAKPTPTPVKASTNAPVTVRAEIVSASKVPDPKKVAYKDSIIFFKYKVISVQSGKYDEQELLAAHWGMKNKKLFPASRYKVGDIQTIQIEPLDKHPELESLQRNDDTGEFNLDPYWVSSIK